MPYAGLLAFCPETSIHFTSLHFTGHRTHPLQHRTHPLIRTKHHRGTFKMDDPHAAAVARTEAYLKEKLDTLRRRDNIRDFVQGIKDSECWPYPEGQHGHVKAALTLDTSGYEQVAIKPLLHMFLRKIKLEYILLEVVTISTDEAAQKLVNLTMKLAPEHGPNYCQEDVEELAGAKDRTKVNAILTPSDLRTLRSALSHRFQWVVDKVNSVNYLREKAYRKHLNCIGFVVSDDEDEMASVEGSEEGEQMPDNLLVSDKIMPCKALAQY